jgi:CBS-domain-containing membrane protein
MKERTDRESSIPTSAEGRGRKSLREIMTANPSTVSPQDDIQTAAKLMVECDCGALPVIGDDRKVTGMITDRDIVIRLIATGRNPMEAKVSDAMSSQTHTVRENDSIEKVFRMMRDHQVRRLPVVDDRNEVIGIVAQADLALETPSDAEVGETVEQISRPDESRPGR